MLHIQSLPLEISGQKTDNSIAQRNKKIKFVLHSDFTKGVYTFSINKSIEMKEVHIMKYLETILKNKNGLLAKSIVVLLTVVMLVVGCGVNSDNTQNEVIAKSIPMLEENNPGSGENNPMGNRPQGGLQQGRRPQGPPPNGQMPQGGMMQGQQRPLQGGMMQGQQQPQQGGMMQGQGPGGFGEGSSVSIEEANAIEEQLVGDVDTSSLAGNYPIVDTGTENYYSNTSIISKPSEGQNYFGQDANYKTNVFSYTDNGDGTVTDNVTRLMWQQDPGDKMTWSEAVSLLEGFELAGYTDWRLPTIKELYSLIDFSGDTGGKSYIDTDYFIFTYGNERIT